MDIKQLLLEFSALTGVAGQEDEAADFGAELLSAYGSVSRSPVGSVLCQVRAPQPGEPHLLLDAHMDEVGGIVTYIEEDGFLRMAGCGGIDRRILMASPVVVHGRKGSIPGIICSTPPHLSSGQEKKNAKVEEVAIDIGCTKRQAEKLVSPGDRITFYSPSRMLLGDLCCGKALDDRAGCIAILYALELLKDKALSCGLTAVFSTMEEVGGQGAKTAAYQVEPTHAIAIDVSFAHTPDAPPARCGKMGKGPMVGFAPILSASISQELCAIAKKEEIPYQTEVMSGKTGTNADPIAVSRSGVLTGLVSIPQKYMHTPIETVSIADVEQTGRLLAAYARALSGKGGEAL